jgi:hypothetical protein
LLKDNGACVRACPPKKKVKYPFKDWSLRTKVKFCCSLPLKIEA